MGLTVKEVQRRERKFGEIGDRTSREFDREGERVIVLTDLNAREGDNLG